MNLYHKGSKKTYLCDFTNYIFYGKTVVNVMPFTNYVFCGKTVANNNYSEWSQLTTLRGSHSRPWGVTFRAGRHMYPASRYAATQPFYRRETIDCKTNRPRTFHFGTRSVV